MTNNKLRSLVAEAVSLDREIKQQSARLKEVEAALKTEATSCDDLQMATDGGGWSVTFEGADGCIARITQAGPKLKSSVSAETDIAKIKAATGVLFGQLFVPTISYKPVANFRDRAAEILGKGAAKLVKLCTGKGSVSVSYETTSETIGA